MKVFRQRRIELGMNFDEFDTVSMLEKMKKRQRMENFELQSLKNIGRKVALKLSRTLRIIQRTRS